MGSAPWDSSRNLSKKLEMRLLILLIAITFSNGLFSQEVTPFSIGETRTFKSEILDEERTLNIYLPDSYHPDSSRAYPVVYLLDGSRNEDFIHVAGLVQFCSFSWINTLPETIIIGIGNVDRKRDFTYPTTIEQDKKDFPTTGGSAKFIDFLEKELKPYIEQNYKVLEEATLIGQSLGGLLATEILLKRPTLFTNYIIISPSLWWDHESLLALEESAFKTDRSIYVGVGKEGRVMERTAKELYKKLRQNAIVKNRVFFNFFENRDHGDILHEALYDAFEKLFDKKNN